MPQSLSPISGSDEASRVSAHYPELVRFLKEYVLKYGDFRLSSGERSTFYLDGKIISHSPKGLRLVCEAIAEELRPLNVSAVGGLELGATPIVGAYVLYSEMIGDPREGITVRKQVKEHGTRKRTEGADLNAKSHVVILDDVVTTGASICEAVSALKGINCHIEAAVSIVDREGDASEKLKREGIKYMPLVTATDLGVDVGHASH